MTPEKQRIAIAEACGIEDQNECPCCHLYRRQGHMSECSYVPNYPNDLNAMREAVHSRITSPLLQAEYFYQLNDVIGLVSPSSPAWIKEFGVFAHSQATAAQRAEAFLRTIGLWEEESL